MVCVWCIASVVYRACGKCLKHARGCSGLRPFAHIRVHSRFQSSHSFPFAHIRFRLRIFVNLIDRCRYRYFTFGGSVLLFVSIVLQTLHVWCVFACAMCTFLWVACAYCAQAFVVRVVAQLGRALRSGRRGRRFKSCQPDHVHLSYCIMRRCFVVVFTNL